MDWFTRLQSSFCMIVVYEELVVLPVAPWRGKKTGPD
jgi:hypothetical protein